MSKSKRKAKKLRRLPPAEVIYRSPVELAGDDEDLAETRKIFAELDNPHQRAFLAGYVRAKGIRRAERLSGVCRNAHYTWMKQDDRYAECFREARRIVADDAEEEVFQRAFHGFYLPIIYGGKIKGWYKGYSDALAMFVLRGLKRGIYGPNAEPEYEGPTSMRITIVEPGKPERELSAGEPTLTIPQNDPEA